MQNGISAEENESAQNLEQSMTQKVRREYHIIAPIESDCNYMKSLLLTESFPGEESTEFAGVY